MPNFHLLLGPERAEILSDRAAQRGTSILAELKRVVDESVTNSNSSPIGFAGLEPEGKPLKEGKGEESCSLPSSPLQGLLLPENLSCVAKLGAVGKGGGAGGGNPGQYRGGTKMVPSTKEDASSVVEFPPSLRTEKFAEAWESWIQYRREAKLVRWKPVTVRAKLKELEGMGHDAACEAIRSSIANGYQGVFAPKSKAIQAAAPPLARHLLVTSDYRKAEHRVAELALPAEEHLAWLEKIRAAKNVEELAAIVARAEAGRG